VSTLSTHTQSRRLESVQTPVIPVVGRWITATPGTLSLGQGIVSYGPPPEVIEAVQRFGGTIDDHRYGPVEGLAALIEMLEQKLARENGITVRPDSRVVVTAGGNLAFMNAVLAIADAGDELILSVPYYFNHEMAIVMAGARPVAVQTRSDLQLDVEAIARAITPRTRAVVTVSPNNPTGAVYDEASLQAVNALCRDRGLFHIHDEAYEYFTYGVPHFSPGSIAGAAAHTISLYSLSKAYGMASWRVGYMVIPDALWSAVNKIQDTLLICPPAVSQRAAAAALTVGATWATDRLVGLNTTRRKMREALGAGGMPVDVIVPDGAFYFFMRVRSTMDPMTLTERLIREHKVAVMPGSAFGAAGCALRVSYGALDADSVAEGLTRLVTGLRTIVGEANMELR
jgi:aspartate/methionine/tyrosine aminotransferase